MAPPACRKSGMRKAENVFWSAGLFANIALPVKIARIGVVKPRRSHWLRKWQRTWQRKRVTATFERRISVFIRPYTIQCNHVFCCHLSFPDHFPDQWNNIKVYRTTTLSFQLTFHIFICIIYSHHTDSSQKCQRFTSSPREGQDRPADSTHKWRAMTDDSKKRDCIV